MAYSVSTNASFLTGASVIQKVISFVYFTLVTRYLGLELTGIYVYAFSFVTIFSVVADAGLGPVLTREVSKQPEQAATFLPTVFWSKISLGLVSYGLIAASAQLLNYSPVTRQLIYVCGITMFFDNLQTVFFSILRAHKNLFYEALGVIIAQGSTLVIGTLVLLNHWPITWLVLAFTIPSAVNAGLAATVVWRKFKLRFFHAPDWSVARTLLSLAWPFALASGLGRLYSYSDSVLISKWLRPEDLSWWVLPNKITTAFQFIPIALTASIYPAMSSWFITEKEKVGELFARSWQYLLVCLLPITLGIFALSAPLVTYLSGPKFLPSAPILQVLLISINFSFLALVTGATLNATGYQKFQTMLLGASLGVNLLLNIFLLPRYGIIGAAAAQLISNIFLLVVGLKVVAKKISLPFGRILTYFQQAFWPALIMAVIVYGLSTKINFWLTIPIGGVIYLGLLTVTGVLTKDVIAAVVQKVTKRASV